MCNPLMFLLPPLALPAGLSWTSKRPPSYRRTRLQAFDSTNLYEIQSGAGQLVADELTHVSPLSLAILYGTGLVMSFTPCALSLLPLTVSYVVGTGGEGDDEEAGAGAGAFGPSLAFATGLASVLSVLGLSATLAAGKMFGSLSLGELNQAALPLFASALAIAMGLNLLELITVDLPSTYRLDFNSILSILPRLFQLIQYYIPGASSALVASPCSTPVLASILGFVATSKDPVLGLVLLLAYSLGYTTPLVVAGTASGALQSIMSLNGQTWVTPAFGGLLIGYGTYTGLAAIFS
ncbi:unnamed protein product [Chrysoparadoxa australica]